MGHLWVAVALVVVAPALGWAVGLAIHYWLELRDLGRQRVTPGPPGR